MLFGKEREIERLKQEAILDMTDLLISYGFKVDEAVRVAKEFWEKYKKKLKEVYP